MEKLTKDDVVLAWFFCGLRDLFFAFQIDSPFRYEPFMNTMGFEKLCKSYLLAENSSKYENLEDGTVAKYQVEKVGLDWKDVVNKLTKNDWAKLISPTEMRLDVNLGIAKGSMLEVFGDNFLKILPILQQSQDNKAKEKINSLAKGWGHDLEEMINKIAGSIGNQIIENITSQSFDGYTGKQLIKVMQAAYLECRYPVPRHIHEEFPVNGKPDMYWEPIASSGIEKFCFTFTRTIITHLKEKFDILIPEDSFNEILNGEAGVRFRNLFLKDTPDDFLK